MDITIIGPCPGLASVSEPILRALPEWFGDDASNIQYVKDIDAFPTLAAFIAQEAVGFLTIKEHNDYAAEIHVMGVCPAVQRQGIGRALVQAAESSLRQHGVEYLQVKTLSSSDPDEHYAATRAFYFAIGFRPLEDFDRLWSEANPCVQMVKHLVCNQI
jgi:ribosomal protein S18 acetylase RimI-like enzyme